MKNEEIEYATIVAFLQLIEHPHVRRCLQSDLCYRFSDKYLIATTLVYFKRGNLSPAEFNPANFFRLLFLANDMEEDIDFKVIKIFKLELDCFRNYFKYLFGEKDGLKQAVFGQVLSHETFVRGAPRRFCEESSNSLV